MLSKEAPVVGRKYSLEDAATGTLAQGKTFHALAQEYWRSGQHSYQARDFIEFKNIIKRELGAGFEAFVYIDGGKICDAKTLADIPESIRTAPNKRELIRGRLRSWSEYSKKERRETIDRLKSEMLQVGVNSKKFMEILEGMERCDRKD